MHDKIILCKYFSFTTIISDINIKIKCLYSKVDGEFIIHIANKKLSILLRMNQFWNALISTKHAACMK